MKNLEFSFHDGKQRVINMLESHIESFERDMLQDVKITIINDKEDMLDSVEDIVETARRNRNNVEKAIFKVKNSTCIQDILKAVGDTCFEEQEEIVLMELFDLKNITIKFY